MNSLCKLAVVGAAAFLAGCGATVSDTPQTVTPVETPVKSMLQEVAQSGELGSAAMEIRESLEQMKASGDAKADELLKDLDELETMGNPAALKKKAQEMAAKL